jgi:phosphomannomutase
MNVEENPPLTSIPDDSGRPLERADGDSPLVHRYRNQGDCAMMHTILKSFVRDLKSAVMPSWTGAKKTVATVVAGVLMYTTVASPLVEAGFWEDRQSVAKSRNSNGTGTQYAMLPAGAGALAEAMPFLENSASTGGDLGSLSGASLPSIHSSLTPDQRKALPAWMNRISSLHGTISQAYFAPNGAQGPLVVHIQDVHEQREAQLNISGLISEIVGTGGVSLVGLEGAAGAFNLVPYRTYPDKAVVGDVADFLLQEHMIGGGEHAGWTAEKEPTLWGVEEVGVYLKNLNSFKDALPVQERLQDRIKSWDFRLARAKPSVFSPALKSFDDAQSRYQAGTLPLPEFVALIEKTVKLDGAKYPALAAFQRCLVMEKGLNFSDVEKERTRLIESLSKALSEKEISALVQHTLLYKSGRMSYGGYYDSLQSICESKGVSLSRFPAMAAYIKYVLASEQIKPEALLTELDAIQENVATVLVRTPEERALYDLAQDLHSLTNLASFKMAPHDWAVYQKNRDRVMDLPARMDSLAPGSDNYAGDFPKDLVPFEGFCQAALARDETLVENLLAKMKESNQKTGVLLAGGFHTKGMTDLLKKGKVSYVVFTPTLTEINSDSHYLDFIKDRPALEKLFTQEKITTKAAINASVVSAVPGHEGAHSGMQDLSKTLLVALSNGATTPAVDAMSPVKVVSSQSSNNVGDVYSAKTGNGKEVSVTVAEGQTPPTSSAFGQLVASFSGKAKSFSVYVKQKGIAGFFSPLAIVSAISGFFTRVKTDSKESSENRTIAGALPLVVNLVLPIVTRLYGRNSWGNETLARDHTIRFYAPILESLAFWGVFALLSGFGLSLVGINMDVFQFAVPAIPGISGSSLFISGQTVFDLGIFAVLNLGLGLMHTTGFKGKINDETNDLGFNAIPLGLTVAERVSLAVRLFFSQITMLAGGWGVLGAMVGHILHNNYIARYFGLFAGATVSADGAAAIRSYAGNPKPVILETGVKNYDWGQRGPQAFIPNLFGLDASDKPFAEAWIGAHPELPSMAVLPSGEKVQMDALVERAGTQIMSEYARALYQGQLPFLFKVLAAGIPLSIQVHPTKEQAKSGFSAENQAGIELTASNRNYKDPNHKPELIAAVTEFFGLRGFKPLDQMVIDLQANEELMEIPEVSRFVQAPTESNLGLLYGTLMGLPQEQVDKYLSPLIERLSKSNAVSPFSKSSPEYWVLRSDTEFIKDGHHDRGVFSVYLLNLMRLNPGQAMYLSAGVPHAYLEGVGMEIMANSNNVLRGGFTHKHVDVPELLKTVVFKGEPPAIRNGNLISETERSYREVGDVEEFQLSQIQISQINKHTQGNNHDIETLIVLEADGPVQLNLSDGSMQEIRRGQTVMIPQGVPYELSVTGEKAVLFKASVPLPKQTSVVQSTPQMTSAEKALVVSNIMNRLGTSSLGEQDIKSIRDELLQMRHGDEVDVFNKVLHSLQISAVRNPMVAEAGIRLLQLMKDSLVGTRDQGFNMAMMSQVQQKLSALHAPPTLHAVQPVRVDPNQQMATNLLVRIHALETLMSTNGAARKQLAGIVDDLFRNEEAARVAIFNLMVVELEDNKNIASDEAFLRAYASRLLLELLRGDSTARGGLAKGNKDDIVDRLMVRLALATTHAEIDIIVKDYNERITDERESRSILQAMGPLLNQPQFAQTDLLKSAIYFLDQVTPVESRAGAGAITQQGISGITAQLERVNEIIARQANRNAPPSAQELSAGTFMQIAADPRVAARDLFISSSKSHGIEAVLGLMAGEVSVTNPVKNWVSFLTAVDQHLKELKENSSAVWISQTQLRVAREIRLAEGKERTQPGSYRIHAFASSANLDEITVRLNGLMSAAFANQPSLGEEVAKLRSTLSDELMSIQGFVAEVPFELTPEVRAYAVRAQTLLADSLTILSLVERGIPGADKIRLTADSDRQLKATDRAESFIDRHTLSTPMATEENAAGAYNRGIETGAKMKGDFGAQGQAPYNLEAYVLYSMRHGMVPVPAGLAGVTNASGGSVSTFHHTSFAMARVPGTLNAASTGVGHYQAEKLDVKQVTRGEVLQVSVKYDGNGNVVDVLKRRASAGEFAVALPGYYDYLISIGNEPAAFDDVSIDLSALGFSRSDIAQFQGGQKPTVAPLNAPYVWVNGQLEPAAGMKNLPPARDVSTIQSLDGASLLDIYGVLNEGSLRAMAGSLISNAGALVAPTFRGRQPKPLAFGTSGLRGLVTEITDLEVYLNTLGYLNYLQAQGQITGGDTVTIARDFRDSSPRISAAVAKALNDFGVVMEDLGRLSTPALTLWGMQNKRVSIMITGSHIPFDRNGIKFNKASGEVVKADEPGINRHVADVRRAEYIRSDAESLFSDDGKFKVSPQVSLNDVGADRSRDTAYIGKWTSAATVFKSGERRQFSAGEEAYISRYVQAYGETALAGQYYSVYLHSGVGTRLFAEILRRLGANVYEFGASNTFIAIDTEAISAETLGTISEMVNKIQMPKGANMTAVLSTDGDSDRPLVLGLNQADGKRNLDFIPGDIAGAFVAKQLGAKAVAIPISANDVVDTYLEGVDILKTKIGSPYVVVGMEALAEKHDGEVIVGWEANGGFLVGVPMTHRQGRLESLPTRDAALPMVEILAAAAEQEKSVTALFDPLRSRAGKADMIDNFPVATSQAMVAGFSLAAAGVSRVDFDTESRVRVTPEPGKPMSKETRGAVGDRASVIQSNLQKYFNTENGYAAIDWINFTDGIRIHFTNGDIAHIRPSGNAPQLRIYAVSNTSDRASDIVQQAIAEPNGIYRNIERDMASAPAVVVQTTLGAANSLFQVKAKPFSVARVGTKMVLALAAASVAYLLGGSILQLALPVIVATFYVVFLISSGLHLVDSSMEKYLAENDGYIRTLINNADEVSRVARQFERLGFAPTVTNAEISVAIGKSNATVRLGYPQGGSSWLAETSADNVITVRPGIPGWLLPFVIRTEIYRVSLWEGAKADVRLLPGLRRSSATTRGPPVVSTEADLPVDMETIYPVIMSGGDSTRLFPVDKVLTPNLDASGQGRSLMRQMFERLTADQENGVYLPFKRFYMLTAARIAGTVKEQLPEVPAENLLSDPAKRNTFPAILWAMAHIKIQSNNPKATLTVFGADQVVGDTPEFRRVVTETARVAQNAKSVVAIGIQPSENPVQWTNYGAIQAPELAGVGRESRGMNRFVEKPNEEKAKDMIKEGGHYWNAGWFTFTIEALEEAMATNQPEMFATYNEMVDAISRGDADAAKTAFEKFPSKIKQKGTGAEVDNSMDYAIMEYLGQDTPVKGVVVPGGFPWIDAGNWGDVRQVLPADKNGNVIRGQVKVSQTKNSTFFAESGMSIEAVGLEGIAVAVSAIGNVIVTEEVKGGKVKPAVEPAKKEVAKNLDDPTRVNVVQKETENVTVTNAGPGVVAVYGVNNLDISVANGRVTVRNTAVSVQSQFSPVPDVVQLPIQAKVQSFASEGKKEVAVSDADLSTLLLSLIDSPAERESTPLPGEWVSMSPRRMIAWLGYATPAERKAGLAALRANPAKAEAVLGVIMMDAATAHANGRSYKTSEVIDDVAMHQEMQNLAQLGFWLGLSIRQGQEVIDRTYNAQRTMVRIASQESAPIGLEVASIRKPLSLLGVYQRMERTVVQLFAGMFLVINRAVVDIPVLPLVKGPDGVMWQSGTDEATIKKSISLINGMTNDLGDNKAPIAISAFDGELTSEEIKNFLANNGVENFNRVHILGSEIPGIHNADGTLVDVPEILKYVGKNVFGWGAMRTHFWYLQMSPNVYTNEPAILDLGDFRDIIRVILIRLGEIKPLDLDQYNDKVERYLKAQA